MAKKKRYGNKQKVKGGVLRRATGRAKALGREGLLKGGVTGKEARTLRREYKRGQSGKGTTPPSGAPERVSGGVKRRANERLDYLETHGGLEGLQGVRKGGITKPEAQRIRRTYRRERDLNPLQPRSGRQIGRTADALADVAYGPQERELAEQGTNEAGRQNVLYGPGGWFEAYRRDVAAAAQRQQAAETAFQAGANAVALNMGSQTGALQGAPGQQAGGQVSPDVNAQAQQAAQARAAMQQQAATTLATRGAGNVANVNAMAIAAGQQAQEGLMESQARQHKIQSLAMELAREKGDYKAGKVAELTDAERTYSLNRQAFGLNVAEAQEDARHNRATERENRAARRAAQRENDRDFRVWKREFGLERATEMYNRMEKDRRFKLDREKFGFDKAKDKYKRRHGLGDYKPGDGGSDSNVKGDKDGDGIADKGKYKGYSESERDKYDAAADTIRRMEDKPRKSKKTGKTYGGRGWVRKNRETMISALVDKGIPRRIAVRAVDRHIRKTSRHPGVPQAPGPDGNDRPN